MQSDDDYGIENSELGEYDEDEEDEDYDEDEEEDEEEGEEGEDGKLNKKSRAVSLKIVVVMKNGRSQGHIQGGWGRGGWEAFKGKHIHPGPWDATWCKY